MNNNIRHILLDIEGTTCPVSFVSEGLFPYAQQQVAPYLEQHGFEAETQVLLQELQQSWQQEEHPEAKALFEAARLADRVESARRDAAENGLSTATVQAETLLPYVRWLSQKDRKVSAWKELQGRIWQEGYGKGELKACLFDDVVPTLRRWKERGLDLSVYSSGSVSAQQLLYGHCQEGDVRDLFSHWYDTRIGGKQEASSYRRIVTELGCAAAEVLFISDAIGELQAASAAGLQVVFSEREGNPQRDPGPFPSVQRLDQLQLSP